GPYASVEDAYNFPKGVQHHIPVIVGGNGRDRTAGLAIKHADELNFVFLGADEIRERIAEVRARCADEGRDPASLRFSLYALDEDMQEGPERVEVLREMSQVGLARIVCFPGRWDPTVEGQARFAEDCEKAGLALGAVTA